jgi:hypothetical protein
MVSSPLGGRGYHSASNVGNQSTGRVSLPGQRCQPINRSIFSPMPWNYRCGLPNKTTKLVFASHDATQAPQRLYCKYVACSATALEAPHYLLRLHELARCTWIFCTRCHIIVEVLRDGWDVVWFSTTLWGWVLFWAQLVWVPIQLCLRVVWQILLGSWLYKFEEVRTRGTYLVCVVADSTVELFYRNKERSEQQEMGYEYVGHLGI